ncbi:hypothetical protein INS49_003308 [Diaporthe citri]|uniref:uncharacterized protein n=1 Tax=Diaporthe citri TaxID=83186 RepID=UPI001C7EC4CB|nr:uncharacterized protein INS49_003308 [Diaporthe citri]KAG6355347.1 hypothetical protein INS49_003308 [Diaporthe citri]
MASHDPRAPLEALPTEILQMILSQMTCTEDLFAAINASPTIFQYFLGWREEILIRVIQNSLDPGIFMEVLGLLDVPNFGNLHHVPGPDIARLLGSDIESPVFWSLIQAWIAFNCCNLSEVSKMVHRMDFKVDGGCRGNGRPEAIGAAACCLEPRPSSGAEITATTLALEWALGRHDQLEGYPRLEVNIRSDSRYAVGCMTNWIYTWVRNGWKRREPGSYREGFRA